MKKILSFFIVAIMLLSVVLPPTPVRAETVLETSTITHLALTSPHENFYNIAYSGGDVVWTRITTSSPGSHAIGIWSDSRTLAINGTFTLASTHDSTLSQTITLNDTYAYDLALRKDPDNPTTHYLLGIVLTSSSSRYGPEKAFLPIKRYPYSKISLEYYSEIVPLGRVVDGETIFIDATDNSTIASIYAPIPSAIDFVTNVGSKVPEHNWTEGVSGTYGLTTSTRIEPNNTASGIITSRTISSIPNDGQYFTGVGVEEHEYLVTDTSDAASSTLMEKNIINTHPNIEAA